MAYNSGGEYMTAKNDKIFAQNKNAFPAITQLFGKYVFYINGVTSNLELKELIIENGGTIVDHFMPSRTTHIIATSMTLRKMEAIRKHPILKPEFVYDCVKEGRILPLEPYLLVALDLDKRQKKITDIIPKVSLIPDDEDDEMGLDEPVDMEMEEEEVDEKNIYPSYHDVKPDLDMSNPNIRSLISTSPNFIQNYYASSRLHHLSTWKGELIDHVLREMQKLGKKPPKKNDSSLLYMHVDMDSFFCSVALRNKPESRNRPVVICHSTSDSFDPKSTSEIASCNYVARERGITNGSFLGKAYQLAPDDLLVLPYDFEGIKECSSTLYKILVENSNYLQAVSCDEALLEVSHPSMDFNEDACLDLAAKIREEIFTQTKGCTASIGIGKNLLLARLATHKAKPNGVYYLHSSNTQEYLRSLKISKMPRVGWATLKKFQTLQIETCGEVQAMMSLEEMKKEFGVKLGIQLYEFCRGIDTRTLENKTRQSIGCEINWAMRFQTQLQVQEFVRQLAKEVYDRLKNSKMISDSLSIKAKKRDYEGEPGKFLGCGHCIDYSKTSPVRATPYNSAESIFRDAYNLLVELQIPATEVRGLGIHLKHRKVILENGQRTISFSGMPAAPTAGKKILVTPSPPRRRVISFFSPKKSRFFEKYGFRPEELDLSAYNALPDDLKREIDGERKETAKNATTSKNNKRSPPKRSLADEYLDLPSSSQWDPEFLDNLPPAFKIEFMLGAKRRKKEREKERALFDADRYDDDLEIIEEIPSMPEPLAVPQLAGETDPSKCFESIKEWASLAEEGDPPLPEDITLISDYIIFLAESMQLDVAVDILRYLSYRLTSVSVTLSSSNSSGHAISKEWKKAFESIHSSLDATVMELHGGSIIDLF